MACKKFCLVVTKCIKAKTISVFMYVLVIIHLITGHKILCLLQFNVMTNNSFRLQYMIILYLPMCYMRGLFMFCCITQLPNKHNMGKQFSFYMWCNDIMTPKNK